MCRAHELQRLAASAQTFSPVGLFVWYGCVSRIWIWYKRLGSWRKLGGVCRCRFHCSIFFCLLLNFGAGGGEWGEGRGEGSHVINFGRG